MYFAQYFDPIIEFDRAVLRLLQHILAIAISVFKIIVIIFFSVLLVTAQIDNDDLDFIDHRLVAVLAAIMIIGNVCIFSICIVFSLGNMIAIQITTMQEL